MAELVNLVKTSDQYYGSIKAIGTSSNSGRLGMFTYSGADSTALKERLSITDDGFVGIGTTIPSATLEVNGSTVVDVTLYAKSNLNVTSNLSVGGNATLSGNAAVSGSLTDNGFGVVVGNSATQLKMAVYTATLSASNLTPFSLLGVTGTIGIAAGTFSGTPTAYVGNIISASENGGYYRVSIIPDNVTPTNVSLKIYNNSNTTVSFSNVQWKILVIGPK